MFPRFPRFILVGPLFFGCRFKYNYTKGNSPKIYTDSLNQFAPER